MRSTLGPMGGKRCSEHLLMRTVVHRVGLRIGGCAVHLGELGIVYPLRARHFVQFFAGFLQDIHQGEVAAPGDDLRAHGPIALDLLN